MLALLLRRAVAAYGNGESRLVIQAIRSLY